VKEMDPSVISHRMLIFDGIYQHWSIVCYLFWKANRLAYSFRVLIFLSHHSKFSMFVQWLHQIIVLHLWIELDTFSSYIRFIYMTIGIIIGLDIVMYIIILLWIFHFNGKFIKQWYSHTSLKTLNGKYLTRHVIIGVDIVIYIIMLLWIFHFNGYSIKQWYSHFSLKTLKRMNYFGTLPNSQFNENSIVCPFPFIQWTTIQF
jgi:hypothetical protein